MIILGYASSLVMGLLLGLTGAGGSILTMPILVYLFHMKPSVATGHSLFVVGLTALIGSAAYIRRGLDVKTILLFLVPSAAGVALARKWLLPHLPDTVIMTAFALLMIGAAVMMLRSPKTKPARLPSAVLAALGLAVGVTAGCVGAGGGFLIVPSLVLIAGLEMKAAVGASLTIIAGQSLTGFGQDLFLGTPVEWPLLIKIAALAGIGILAGNRIASRMSESKMRRFFGWFVLCIGTLIVMDQIYHA